jgi:methyltransferase
MIVALLLLVFVPMLVEAGRATHNERALRAAGGIEPRGDVYPLMRVAYPLFFLAMIAEGAWRGAAPPAIAGLGLVVFLRAKALKWWAIVSLGRFWTFRVIVVPGTGLVRSGPYRFLRHPNYVGVVGELAGVALMTTATITGPLALVGFGMLLARRIAVEERALAPR